VRQALREAEPQIIRPPAGSKLPVIVEVRVDAIGIRPELFQPRRFSQGLREVDPDHVKRLATRIQRKGELHAPLLVKLKTPLGEQWVCVDGHHRIEAYKKRKWKAPIKCEWFVGSAQEAADESLRRNEVIKLPIGQADKFEAAWQRTLNGVGSKADVVTLTGASEGIVAMMRRVKKHYADQTPEGQALKKKLGGPLDTASWREVRALWLDLDPRGDWSAEEEAAKLARQLTNRMTNKLSRSPQITAKALWLYDPDLCGELVRELEKEISSRTRDETDLANWKEGV
jgi:hypothetical protein